MVWRAPDARDEAVAIQLDPITERRAAHEDQDVMMPSRLPAAVKARIA